MKFRISAFSSEFLHYTNVYQVNNYATCTLACAMILPLRMQDAWVSQNHFHADMYVVCVCMYPCLRAVNNKWRDLYFIWLVK